MGELKGGGVTLSIYLFFEQFLRMEVRITKIIMLKVSDSAFTIANLAIKVNIHIKHKVDSQYTKKVNPKIQHIFSQDLWEGLCIM